VTEPESTDKAAAKRRGRPWPKGISGNPGGCRTGSRHRATILIEQLMAGDAEAARTTVGSGLARDPPHLHAGAARLYVVAPIG
jgi:hypothetical protein